MIEFLDSAAGAEGKAPVWREERWRRGSITRCAQHIGYLWENVSCASPTYEVIDVAEVRQHAASYRLVTRLYEQAEDSSLLGGSPLTYKSFWIFWFFFHVPFVTARVPTSCFLFLPCSLRGCFRTWCALHRRQWRAYNLCFVCVSRSGCQQVPADHQGPVYEWSVVSIL